ncbi:MAG: SGNH/GDSL hydrolase family protein [Myxococcales bacterium]|jgi:lysophospholipase L1-like esterase|nr:SGNH/GDSL hydrolase family protein [Myxococcales bacterium]HQY63664.1 GDSL-type esterase/lipase family protein [Polyangiaceae bacterium]
MQKSLDEIPSPDASQSPASADASAPAAETSGLAPAVTARTIMAETVRFGACFGIVFLVMTVILEVCLRVFVVHPFSLGYVATHPTRNYQLVPGYRGTTYDKVLEINSYGMRDEERAPNPSAFRVAVFGDSLTFGQGVEEPKLYSKQLQGLLASDSATPVQVFNFAVPGYATALGVDRWREIQPQFRPDLVIFQFSIANECLPTSKDSAKAAANARPIVRKTKDTLRLLYTYDYLAARFYGALQPAPVMDPRAVEKRYADDSPGWLQCRELFTEIASFARSSRTRVVLALVSQTALGPLVDEPPVTPKLTAALDEAGLKFHVMTDDVLRPYAGNEGALNVRFDDPHFSELRHTLVAKRLHDYLKATGSVSREAIHGSAP